MKYESGNANKTAGLATMKGALPSFGCRGREKWEPLVGLAVATAAAATACDQLATIREQLRPPANGKR